jgi:hypothetical protein
MVDLRERELLAQPVALPLVRGRVNGLGKEERFIELVESCLDGSHPARLIARSRSPPPAGASRYAECDRSPVACRLSLRCMLLQEPEVLRQLLSVAIDSRLDCALRQLQPFGDHRPCGLSRILYKASHHRHGR